MGSECISLHHSQNNNIFLAEEFLTSLSFNHYIVLHYNTSLLSDLGLLKKLPKAVHMHASKLFILPCLTPPSVCSPGWAGWWGSSALPQTCMASTSIVKVAPLHKPPRHCSSSEISVIARFKSAGTALKGAPAAICTTGATPDPPPGSMSYLHLV